MARACFLRRQLRLAADCGAQGCAWAGWSQFGAAGSSGVLFAAHPGSKGAAKATRARQASKRDVVKDRQELREGVHPTPVWQRTAAMSYWQGQGNVRHQVAVQDSGHHGPVRKAKAKAAPAGKRQKGDDTGGADAAAAGLKKNRHAFCDVTNQENTLPNTSRPRGSQEAQGQLLGSQVLQNTGQPNDTSNNLLGQCLQHDHHLGSSQPHLAVKEIDVQDQYETYTCASYAAEIFTNLFASEKLRRPSTTYMEAFQTDLNPNMRSILVDWMVEVAQEYDLVADTLFLAVSFLDRYLSSQQVLRSRLQLVGVTCMLIAAKYEEIYAPQIEDFCFITENTYTRQDIIQMESDILDTLAFECTTPTVKLFLRRFARAAEEDVPDDKLHFLTSYLAELALPEYAALQYLPSQIAAAAVMVASYTLGNIPWTATLQHYSRCQARELRAPALLLHRLFRNARTSSVIAVREKFSAPKYKCVASVPAPDSLPEWLFQTPGSHAASVRTPPRNTEAGRLAPEWSATSAFSAASFGSQASMGPLHGSGGSGVIKAHYLAIH